MNDERGMIFNSKIASETILRYIGYHNLLRHYTSDVFERGTFLPELTR